MRRIVAQIVIDGDGEIGIGTSTPQEDVHIKTKNIRIEPSDPFYGSGEYMEFKPYYSDVIFQPHATAQGYLGTGDRYFLYAYFKYGRIWGNVAVTSDIRMKENIRELDKGWALNTLNQLKPKKYDLMEDLSIYSEHTRDYVEKARLDNYGLIAQEVEKILPEIVSTEDDEMGTKGINYIALIPILIDAVKDLSAEIESLKTKSSLKSSSTANIETTFVEQCYLGQNQPNPFSESTEISYQLPGETESASLYIYNMQGSQVKSYDITRYGSESLTISGYELTPGMYYYTLIADGKEIDTKKMILTD